MTRAEAIEQVQTKIDLQIESQSVVEFLTLLREYEKLTQSTNTAANTLIDAVYANLQQGTFHADTEPNPTIGQFIVGLHIREELVELEELL